VYKDKVNGGEKTQQGVVKVMGEVDRVYKDTADVVTVNGIGAGDVTIQKYGFKDVVVWYALIFN
jgi:D-hexose-6-phosphate mutarotase